MSYKDRIRRVLPYLSPENRAEVLKSLNQISEDELKDLLTAKRPCKLCGEMLEAKEIMEHAVLKHADMGAGKVLDNLNKFRGT